MRLIFTQEVSYSKMFIPEGHFEGKKKKSQLKQAVIKRGKKNRMQLGVSLVLLEGKRE